MKQETSIIEKYIDSLVDSNGNAHITVDLRHGNEIFEPYSSKRDLSSSLLSYIESVAKCIPLETPLIIDFIINPSDKPLAARIEKEYKTSCRFSFEEKRALTRKTWLRGWIMMGIGIFWLIIYMVFSVLLNNNAGNLIYAILSNVFSIVSWVFIWDAVDKWSFERRSYQVEMLRQGALAMADIRFIVSEEEKTKPEEKK